MKNLILLIALLFVGFISRAQTAMTLDDMFPKNAIYYIPGGQQITHDKIDSVIKSWGGKFNVEHTGKNEIFLSPTTAADQQQIDVYKNDLNNLVDHPAPDFSLKDINGSTVKLSAYKGQIVVLNFWYTACIPCIEEMPVLNEIRKLYENKKVKFIALAIEDGKTVNKFLARHEFDYDIIPDAKEIHKKYQVNMCPTSIVIDQDGIVKFVQLSGDNIDSNLNYAISALKP